MITKLRRILSLTLAFAVLAFAMQWLLPLSLALVIASVSVFVWIERRLVLPGSATARLSADKDAPLDNSSANVDVSAADNPIALQCQIIRKFDHTFSPAGHSVEYTRGRFDAVAERSLAAGNNPAPAPAPTLWQELHFTLRQSESLKLLFSSAFAIACAVAIFAALFVVTTELGNVGLKKIIEITVPMFTGNQLRIERLRVTPQFLFYVLANRGFFAKADVKSLVAFLERLPKESNTGELYLLVEGAQWRSSNFTANIELLQLRHPADLRVDVRGAVTNQWNARLVLALAGSELRGRYSAQGSLFAGADALSPGLKLSALGRITGAAGKYLFAGTIAHRHSRAEFRLSTDIHSAIANFRLHGDLIEITPEAAGQISRVSAVNILPGTIGMDAEGTIHSRRIIYRCLASSTRPPGRLRAVFTGEIPANKPLLYERGFRWHNIIQRSAEIETSGENLRLPKSGRETLGQLGWQVRESATVSGTRTEATTVDRSWKK